MLQKIKYPVGSKIKRGSFDEVVIGDITSGGLIAFIVDKNGDVINYVTQKQLDEGNFNLVSAPRWIPEIGDTYFTIYNDGSWGSNIWKGDNVDLFRLKTDNVKRTSEECQKKIGEINSREI